MPRKPKVPQSSNPVVTFSVQDRTYQIDTEQQKVYQRFVQIETSKAMEIFSMWRAQNASV
jgi:hypothetical protein